MTRSRASGALAVTMAPGTYILVCNVYNDSGAHYQLGMASAFTVTQ
jgi:uncharacterized cupredoxin-like copper-binding protein